MLSGFPEDTLASGDFSELHRSRPPSPGYGLHRTVNPLPLLMIFLSLDADLFQCCLSTSALTSKARLSGCPATVAFLLPLVSSALRDPGFPVDRRLIHPVP